ncbi:MAG: type II toxin-antitoxin system HicA family toxin [Nanoarchaeota archaeon]
MAELRKISGDKLLKILCNKFGFITSGRKGSHIRISKQTEFGKIGTVIPMHDELKIGTLKAILKQAQISEEEFKRFL